MAPAVDRYMRYLAYLILLLGATAYTLLLRPRPLPAPGPTSWCRERENESLIKAPFGIPPLWPGLPADQNHSGLN